MLAKIWEVHHDNYSISTLAGGSRCLWRHWSGASRIFTRRLPGLGGGWPCRRVSRLMDRTRIALARSTDGAGGRPGVSHSLVDRRFGSSGAGSGHVDTTPAADLKLGTIPVKN